MISLLLFSTAFLLNSSGLNLCSARIDDKMPSAKLVIRTNALILKILELMSLILEKKDFMK